MYPHHRQSIQNVTEYFGRDPQVLALLLGGSIAHGFESRTSDIEILYPYHKWFLKVLEGAKDKPDDL